MRTQVFLSPGVTVFFSPTWLSPTPAAASTMQRRRLRSVAAALAPRPSTAAAGPPQIDTEGGTLANWDVELVPPPGGAAGPHTNRATRRSDPSEVHESKLAIVEGVGHPPFCDQQRYTELRASTRGTLRPDDVVVSTYPKCGTTWSEQVVLLLQNGGDTSGLNPATKNSFHPEELPRGKIWMEAMIDQDTSSGRPAEGEFRPLPLSDFVALPSPRLIKTHAPVEMLLGGSDEPGAPPCGGAKIVYVSRNLKDACVSSYYHAFNPFESGWPFDAWAAAWLSGGSSFGQWCEVTRDWYALSQRWPEQILFVLVRAISLPASSLTSTCTCSSPVLAKALGQ